jgi:hypothetical protein
MEESLKSEAGIALSRLMSVPCRVMSVMIQVPVWNVGIFNIGSARMAVSSKYNFRCGLFENLLKLTSS